MAILTSHSLGGIQFHVKKFVIREIYELLEKGQDNQGDQDKLKRYLRPPGWDDISGCLNYWTLDKGLRNPGI